MKKESRISKAVVNMNSRFIGLGYCHRGFVRIKFRSITKNYVPLKLSLGDNDPGLAHSRHGYTLRKPYVRSIPVSGVVLLPFSILVFAFLQTSSDSFAYAVRTFARTVDFSHMRMF
jgi:hypothetical protein